MEYTKKGKIVGHSRGEVYFTERKPIHFMRKFQGFGISNDILISLHNNLVKWVKIKYLGVNGDVYYKVELDKFYLSDKTYTDDCDLQRFVSVKDMSRFTPIIKPITELTKEHYDVNSLVIKPRDFFSAHAKGEI